MSVLAVTDSTATRPASGYRNAGGSPGRSAPGWSRTAPGGHPPAAPAGSLAPTAPVGSPAPAASPIVPAEGQQGPITVTVSVGVADPSRRVRVLAALQQLIAAAGNDIAIIGSNATTPATASATAPAEAMPAGADPAAVTTLISGATGGGPSAVAGPGVVATAAQAAGLTPGAAPVLVAPASAQVGFPAQAGFPASVGLPALDSAPRALTSRRAVLRLEPGPRTVAFDGRPLELSRLEFDLLLFLVRHPSQVFSRVQLLAQVWGHTHTGARTVDVHVSRLRTKLGTDADVIATVYGLGYRLADDAPVSVVDR